MTMTLEDLWLGLKLPYAIRARLQPALIAALPVSLAAVVWFTKGFEGMTALIFLLSWAGTGSVLMAVARARGRAIESAMWTSWGGSPTTRALRFRDAPNPALLKVRHAALRKLVPDGVIPADGAAEAANRKAADSAYEACVSVLRNSTRAKRKFPLVFEENCNYGYARNLLGLKPLAAWASVLGMVAIGIHTWRAGAFVPLDAAALAVILVMLLWWRSVEAAWVRTVAEAYAERLLEAAVELAAQGVPHA